MIIFRLYLILLMALSSFIRIEAQSMSCDSQLIFYDGFFYFDGTYDASIGNLIDDVDHNIILTNNDGSVSSIFLNSEDGIFSFPIGDNISCTGTYSITNLESGNSCWGSFVNTAFCADYIIPPTPECIYGIEGSLEMASCDLLGSDLWPHISKGFCIGDTSRFNISPDQLVFSPNSLQPFTLDRLLLSNGVVISYDEFGFDVVWDEIGTECISLTTTVENGSEITTAISVRIHDKIKLEIFLDNATPESIELCIGESITLTTELYENISTSWLPDRGIKEYGKSIELSYEIPGTYELVLNQRIICECAIPDTVNILVLPGDIPGIQCTGTICADSEATYYSDMECDIYLWVVSPEGTIIDGGGPSDYFITINWTNGPVGEVVLTTPGCSSNPCNESVTEMIPIIDGSAVIYGPTEVCYGERQEYSLINYTGTEFEWSVDGPGFIVGNNFKRNPTLIQWRDEDPDNTATISVSFENCNLACSGSANLNVLLLEDIYIDSGDRKFCRMANLNVSNNLGYNVDWTIINPDGSESNFNNVSILSTTLSDIGDYTIRLSNPASPTCNLSDEIKIKIHDNPDAPSHIEGPEVICKNKLIQYSIPDLGAYDIVHWQVFDGTVIAPSNEKVSRNITIAWTSDGPYKLSASIENSVTRCISEATEELYDTEILMTGPDTICIATEFIYTITPYFGGEVEWSVSPSTAAEIIYTQGDSASIVALSNAPFTVNSTYCDNTAMTQVFIPLFDVSLNYEKIVCQNEIVQMEVTAPSGSSSSISTYPENDLVSTSSTSGLPSGDYLVEVTSPYGCYYSEEISIAEQDTFEVNITSPGPFTFCMPHDPIVIYATVLGVGYSYAWYRNGMLLSEASSTLMATEYGSYYVIATSIYGCKQFSDNINLGKPTAISGPQLDTEKTDITCVDKAFKVVLPYESDTFNWYFGDGSFATGPSVVHTFKKAGYYRVRVNGNGGCETNTGVVCDTEVTSTACESGLEIVIIPVVADFKYDPACVNEPTQFLDKSSILPTTTGLIYNWNFGDPTSGNNTSSQKNPTHVYNTLQDYEVTLIVTHPQSNCVTEKKLTISVNETSDVSMDFQVNNCVGYQTSFTGYSSDDDIKYFWQFGEMINGKEQTSRDQNAMYTYTTTGNHLVRLTGINSLGCRTTISQIITISNNTLSGEITSDTEYPKCPEDPVTLTAPQGLTYLWSTNETTNEITIMDSGNYSVTVTDVGGCVYTPFPHLVSDVSLADVIIVATEYSDTGPSQKAHYDSLIICEGQRFILEANELPNVRYIWIGGVSTFTNTNVLEYTEHFAPLSAGRYEYNVIIKDLETDCDGEFGPFLLEIVANPEKAILVSEDESPCMGDIVTVSISNYNPSYDYQWSNGHTGATFSGVATSGMFVTAINSTGCTSTSNYFFVRGYPSVDVWTTGCMEVCFPREMCLGLNDQTVDYYLLKDGETIDQLTLPTNTIEIEGPGDYQLQAINKYGCSTISEILSLSPSPIDHQLSGLVYIDYNENELYEPSDSLLEGVIVTLFNGNTAVGTTTTDINGVYLFDPVEHVGLTARIDVSNLDLELTGDLDSMLIYTVCVEDKMIDFPLVSICQHQETTSDYWVCKGESVDVGGIEYYASDIDTIILELSSGCDSLSIITVLEYIEPEVVTTIDGTCKDTDSGAIYIEILNGSNLIFSIDGMVNAFTDTFAQNLPVGDHLLYIQDTNACNYILPFNIPEVDPPLVDITPNSSCIQQNNGSIEIDILNGSGLTFSLEENGEFNTALLIENLSIGDHLLYIRDENNCDYNLLFNIESYLEPDIILEPNGTCFDQIQGNIIINVVSGNDLIFSMDSTGSYQNVTEFNNLSDGNHILYFIDGNGCAYSRQFTIPLHPISIFDIEVDNACGDNEMGSLAIIPETEGLQFSIDSDNNFGNTVIFNDITMGSHMVYVLSMEGCIDSIDFDVESIIAPTLELEPSSACEDLQLGSLQIDSSFAGTLFALDGGVFVDDLLFTDISDGQHILYYQLDQNCVFEYPFEIELIEEPDLELLSIASCKNEANGEITITTESLNLKFSIDQEVFVEDLQFTNLAPGDYIIFAQNEENCIYKYPISIIELELPTISTATQNSCVNDESGIIEISLSNDDQLISINGGEYSSKVNYYDLSAGIYNIQVVDSVGCSNQKEVEILENPELEVEISVLETDCNQEPFMIIPEIRNNFGAINYRWHDGTTGDSYLANQTGFVTLEVSDECQSVDFEWDLTFAANANDNKIYIPNIFSPNGDGVNDCFITKIDPEIDLVSYHQIIYDRWGNKMFESNDISECWDGFFLEGPVVAGVYVYINEIYVNACDGERKIRKVGDVTVVR